MKHHAGGVRVAVVILGLVVVSACTQEVGRSSPLAPPAEANAELVPAIGWTPLTLGLPAGGYIDGTAYDINDAGVIAGAAYAAVADEPFIWMPGVGFRRLPTTAALPYGTTRAINNEGFVVGQVYNPIAGGSNAVVWSPGGASMTVIPGLDPTRSPWAHGINDRGQVVGEGVLDSDHSTIVGYRYSQQKGLEILPTLGGPRSAGYAISASGAIVGEATAPDLSWHPTVWSPSNVPTDLGSVPGAYLSIPTAINTAGKVVGYSYSLGFNFHPIVWPAPGRPEVLRLPVGATTGYATDIDDLGRIYGWASMPQRVAVVWIPGAGPRILPQAPTTQEAVPGRSSRCGKIAAQTSGQWMIWNRAC